MEIRETTIMSIGEVISIPMVVLVRPMMPERNLMVL